MILDLPKIGQVRFSDDLSEEEFSSQLKRLSEKYDFEIPRGQLTAGEMLKKSAMRGVKQIGSTFGDLIPAMGASALGFNDYAAKQMEEAKATQDEINKYYAPQYRNLSDVKGIGDFPGFALETIAEQAPNIATTLIPGGIGGTLARRAGVTAAERAAMPLIESGATAAELAHVAGRKGAEYAGRGQNAGIFLGSYAQNAPEIFQNIYNETGEMAPGAAMLFGSASAALDSILPAQLLKNVTGPVKVGIVEKLLERSGMDKGLLRSITAGALKGSGTEGLTEGMQEAISIAAENFVDKHESVFGSKEWNRVMESSVRGAVAGGAFGGVGGVPQGIRDRYKNQIDQATKVAQETQKPVPLQIGYDPRVGMGLPQVIYVHPDGSTSFVSELSDEALASKYAPVPITGAPVENEKARVNRERLEKQRYDAEVKEAQAKLKAGISELINTPTNLVGLAKQPSPLAQTIAQAQGDLNTLASKRGPKAEVIPEPRVAQKAAPLTPQQFPTTITDEVLKGLGIGHTALIRKNKLLEGKDITNPANAAEVRQILEAYAENRSEPIRQKIETYLSRPEFQGTQNATRPISEPSGGSTSMDIGSNLVNAPRTSEEIERDGMVLAEQDVGNIDAREEQQPPTLTEEGTPNGIETIETQQTTQEGQAASTVGKPLGKRAAADKIKAEQGEEEALRDKTKFIRDNDNNTDAILRSRLLAAASDLGISPKNVSVENYRGTEAHNALRLPALLNEHLRLQGVIRTSQEANQKVKNAKELEAIEEAITQAGGNAKEMLGFLDGLNQDQRDAAISQLSRHAFTEFDKVAQQKMRALRNEIEKGSFQPAQVEDTTNEDEYDKLIDNMFEARYGKEKMQFLRDKKYFLPKAIGPALDVDGRAIAEKGNFKDLLSHIIDKTDNKLVRQILRKIQSLGIVPKIVIGKVGANKAGSYNPNTNTITIDSEIGLNHHTVVHEIVHAAISHVLRNPNHKLTKSFVKFFEQIKNQMGTAYGGQDIQEFASELVGNPEFQALLKTIKAPRSENMFVNMMQAIGEFLGFRSAYAQGMKFINDAVDISSGIPPTPADEMFLSMGSAVNSAFNKVGSIGQNMPSLAGQTLENTKNMFSNVKDFGWMKTAMGLLRLDNINTLYGKELPSIQKLLDALELRNGMQEQRISAINKDYKRFSEIAKANTQAMERMNNMAIDARLYEVDPLDTNFKTTPTNAAQYHRLRNIYTSLPSDVQDVYRDIRNFYMKSLNEYEQLLLKSVSPSLAARLTQQFATRKKLTAYIPFLRDGEFWLEFADPATAERAAMAFPSIRERQQFIDSILKPQNIQSKSYRNLQNILFNPSSIPPTSFVGRIMADLQAQGASQQQLDSVYQAYLTLFPAESIAKQFLKSKNVLGMERDIVKGYGTTAVKWARKLSVSEYSPQIDNALSEIKAQAENVNRLDIDAAAENILSQKEFLHNPTFNSFTQAATTLSYFEYIAGNISSALVNITSLPMLVWPTLGGRFGFDKASSAMMNASKVAINGMEKDVRYKKLYDKLMDHGQLEHTMAREVLEGRRQKTTDFTGLKGRILDGLSIPFAATERYNRATTAIAAYDLARQNGMNEDAAIQYAITTTKDLHTSGLAATAPKWMQNPIGRVFFTFKSFTWNSAFIMARAFHQAFKGETPAIQRAARRQLLGIYGMAMAFGGVKGMPFYGAASTLATMIQALFGDDDEPFDFNEEMRDFFGELGYKGAFNYVTNIELSNRVGIATDLIFRDDPRGIAEHGYILSAMQQAFGPAGSYAVSVGNGVKMMKEGHVERGIEAMMPSFVRNGMKGMRYMGEGALTLKGDPVDEDINAYNSLMQVIGFSPADLSSNYEKTSAAKSYEKEVGARRVQLLNLHDMAKTAGDSDLMVETKEQIRAFNETHPKDKITGDTLQKSESSRKTAEKNMINGVTFNKKLRGEIEEKFFED
jgi:hypothetical protein